MVKIKHKHHRTPAGLERNKRVTLNLTEPEYESLVRNAREAGMNFGAYARRVSLEGTVTARLSDGDRDLFRELVSFSNELHQWAKEAREKGMPEALAANVEQTRDMVDSLLNRIKI